MPTQAATDYTLDHAPALEGGLTGAIPHTILSRRATADLPFGRIVVLGSDGLTVGPFTGAGDLDGNELGVVVRRQEDVANASDVLLVESGKMANVLTSGEIWMYTVGTVVAGTTPPYVVTAAANLGRLAGAAGSGDTAAVTDAVFQDKVTLRNSGNAGLVKIAFRY